MYWNSTPTQCNLISVIQYAHSKCIFSVCVTLYVPHIERCSVITDGLEITPMYDKLSRFSCQHPDAIRSQFISVLASRDSTVGKATGYGMDDRGVEVRVPVGLRIFTSPSRPDFSEAHPDSYPMVPGVKRSGREADHSSPTSTEVKNTWVYISTPPYVFIA
jgi:hypothetical protein